MKLLITRLLLNQSNALPLSTAIPNSKLEQIWFQQPTYLIINSLYLCCRIKFFAFYMSFYKFFTEKIPVDSLQLLYVDHVTFTFCASN